MLLRLEMLSVYRSNELYTYLAPKFVVYAFFYAQAVCFALYYVHTIPGIHTISELVSGLFFRYWPAFIALDLLLRILFRTVPHPLITPFAVLPVPARALIRIAHWKSLANHFNLIWILFFIPLILSSQHYNTPLLVAFVFLVIHMDYVSVILKLTIPRIAALILSAILLLVLFSNRWCIFVECDFPVVSRAGLFLAAALLVLLILVSDFVVIWAYNYHHYRPESGMFKFPGNLHIKSPENSFSHMLLIWRSIVRNVRTRTMMFSTLLILILSGLLIFKLEENHSLLTDYLLTCMHGAAGFSVGYHLFSIDLSILPLLHTSRINQSRYLSAKLWFLNLATLISSTFSIALLVGNMNDLLRIAGNVFLVMGICNPLIVVTGILFSRKLDLSRNSFANAQGSSVYQMISVMIISIIPVCILALVSQVAGRVTSDYLILAVGILILGPCRNITGSLLSVIYNFVKYEKMQRLL